MRWIALALVVLVILAVASISFGVRVVSPADVLAALCGVSETADHAAIVKRVPRAVLAMVTGAALAISGTGMQAITRNPVADPGILGVTSGASLAVVVGIAFFNVTHPYAYMAAAIGGGMCTAVFVYAVGSIGRGGATPLKLALAGAATTAALVSLISAILLPRVDVLTNFQSWQIGGIGGGTWSKIAAMSPVLAAGAGLCFLSARAMNSLALGDDVATALGENVTRARVLTAIGAVVLAASATATTGPIGFVGLVVPHACRFLVGTDHRWLLPTAALAGAALLTGADLVGRIIARPEELQVGIITSIIGAPFFIWIVRRQRLREL